MARRLGGRDAELERKEARITVRFVDETDPQNFVKAADDKTRAFFCETVSNPACVVVELDKVAGEPLDVRVNDQLVARGEAVVVNDKFGVRLTDVVSTKERVRGLS